MTAANGTGVCADSVTTLVGMEVNLTDGRAVDVIVSNLGKNIAVVDI